MARNAVLLLMVFCWVMMGATPSGAGIAHIEGKLVCSDCHTMHYSMQHNYRGGPTDLVTDATGPFDALLKASPNDLCLACHDGTGFAPDVLEDPTDDYPRQAGALSRTGSGNYQTWKGHTLDSKAVAPGGTWSNSEKGLLCIDCHAPHGITTQFRNLWTNDTSGDKFEGKTLTFSYGSTVDLTKDVWFHDGFDTAYRYGVYGTDFNKPSAAQSRYGSWCASCHPNFHGSSTDGNMNSGSGWLRHPTADVRIGQGGDAVSSLAVFNSRVNKVKIMSAGGYDSTGKPIGDNYTPSCFSCHKAHGNRNPFGLVYMSGTGTITEQGDTGGTILSDLCRQCHAQ